MEEERVSIIGLFKALYLKRKVVYRIMGLFFAIGVLVYIISPKEYTTSATLLPDSQSSSGLAGLSGLASLAGVNIGDKLGGGGINTTLYEEVLNSTPFLDKIVNRRFYFPSVNKEMSLTDYLVDYTSHPVTSIIKSPLTLSSSVAGLFKSEKKESQSVSKSKTDTVNNDLLFSNKVLDITGKNKSAIAELKKRIDYSLDIRTGLVELAVSLQDKDVSAQIMKVLVDELSLYVSNYETLKERRNLDFTDAQVKIAQKRYNDAQTNLASFNDRNRNILFSIPKTEGDRLQAQLNLEFNVYNSLLQQREQLRLKVANETPAISVIEPAQVPSTSFTPNFLFNAIISLFLGFFVGSTWVLLKNAVIQIVN
jgi:uncharacterized protein involved in exopolysaccharide biosynthesis